MLPDGSRYVAQTDFARSWSAERHRSADVINAIAHLEWMLACDHEILPEAPRVTRPRDLMARVVNRENMKRVRETLESGGWEEM